MQSDLSKPDKLLTTNKSVLIRWSPGFHSLEWSVLPNALFSFAEPEILTRLWHLS